MMRNEYFSDGFFEGYDWTVEQMGQVDSLNALAARAEARIASVPFSNGEDARQYRDGFASGVKSAYREQGAVESVSASEGDVAADDEKPASLRAA